MAIPKLEALEKKKKNHAEILFFYSLFLTCIAIGTFLEEIFLCPLTR